MTSILTYTGLQALEYVQNIETIVWVVFEKQQTAAAKLQAKVNVMVTCGPSSPSSLRCVRSSNFM